jgi:hypothetical protein
MIEINMNQFQIKMEYVLGEKYKIILIFYILFYITKTFTLISTLSWFNKNI